MKRSEALRKIVKIMREWNADVRIANEVLDVVELEIGMLPPEIHSRDAEVNYKWEPENKRKTK